MNKYLTYFYINQKKIFDNIDFYTTISFKHISV